MFPLTILPTALWSSQDTELHGLMQWNLFSLLDGCPRRQVVVMISEDEEDQQQQEITGANADPEVLQYFWDLASLQQVAVCAVFGVTAPS